MIKAEWTNADALDLRPTCNKLATDTISRQGILNWLETEWDGMVVSVFDGVRNIPSAQPERRWIPCSERLPEHPENDDYYLVTIQCEHYDGWDDYVTGFAEWTKHGWEELSCYIGQIKVIAWQPLPEPYREEER